MENQPEKPSIYVACLASYNSGILHGAWIDAAQGKDAIWNDIKRVLETSPIPDAEEYAIHDHDGFEGLQISEYAGVDAVVRTAEFVGEFGLLGAKVAEHLGGDINEAKRVMNESYCGQFESLADYAEQITRETSTVPENLSYYIDWQAMGRDMDLSGEVFAIETAHDEVHIFTSL